jgi:hypothetical protein
MAREGWILENEIDEPPAEYVLIPRDCPIESGYVSPRPLRTVFAYPFVRFCGSVLQPADPHPVQAAAVDSSFLYLLSNGAVLRTDLAGNVLSTYRLRFGTGFQPASLGVTGNALYLIDRTGRAECFQIR